jgi:hypothetical protein
MNFPIPPTPTPEAHHAVTLNMADFDRYWDQRTREEWEEGEGFYEWDSGKRNLPFDLWCGTDEGRASLDAYRENVMAAQEG